MKLNQFIILLVVIISSILSCGVRDEITNAEVEISDQEFAIPIINSQLSISSLTDIDTEGKSSIRIDEQGRATAVYDGTLVRNEAEFLFPPLPGIGDNILPDTNSNVMLPFDPLYRIDEAIFDKTNMSFYFKHVSDEPITVTVSVPSLTKEGKIWKNTFIISPNNGQIDYETPGSDLTDYEVFPIDNSINFVYDARLPSGERVKMDYAAMRVDVLAFQRVVGYFGNRVFDISGSDIKVNIFNSWLSGGLDFSDPRLSLRVDNSFGFPVRSRVNKLKVVTKNGNSFDIQSEAIDNGLYFDFPTIEEGTVTKQTTYYFDKDNSNLRELFNDKVLRVDYDIDALTNPDEDTSIPNFVNLDAFFQVNLFLEVPMLGQALEFTLGDTLDIDLTQIEDATNLEFKIIHDNGFPVDIRSQVYFLADDGEVVDSTFSDGTLLLDGATVDANGEATNSNKVIRYETFDSGRLEKIKSCSRIFVKGSLDTSIDYGKELWIYDDYVLDLKIGAKVKF